MIEHIKEFEYYYNLGSKRTYTQVAKYFHVGLTSVHRWATAEKWKEEVEARNLAYLKQVKRNLYKKTEKTLNNFNNTVNRALISLSKKIEEDKIALNSVEDLERLVDVLIKLGNYNVFLLDNSLLGFGSTENTDNNENTEQTVSIQTLRSMDQLLSSIKENFNK